MITLERLLESRDRRREMQERLRKDYPGMTLICLTVVMPGNVKRSPRSLKVARAAVTELVKTFGDDNIINRDLETGYEAFLLTSRTPEETKRIVVGIEDTHPLGRLFDIDVFDADGLPLGRQQLGLPSRRCLICDDDARVCMRAGRHDYAELLNKIAETVDAYGC